MGKGQKLRRAEVAPSSSVPSLQSPPQSTMGNAYLPPPIQNNFKSPPSLSVNASAYIPSANAPVFVPSYASAHAAVFESSQPKEEFNITSFLELENEARINSIRTILSDTVVSIGSKSQLKTSQSMQSLNVSSGKSSSTVILKQNKSSSSLANMESNRMMSAPTLNKQMKSSTSMDSLNGSATDGDKGVSSQVRGNILDLVSIACTCGLVSPEGNLILNSMDDYVNLDANMCEVGVLLMKSLLESCGRSVEPFAIPLLPRILALHADRSTIVRDTCTEIILILGDIISPYSIYTVYENAISPSLQEQSDWRVRIGALQLLKLMAPRVTGLISPLLPQLIPLVSTCITDPKRQINGIAIEALVAACSAISNEDIIPLVPQLISVISRPDDATIVLDALLETTFVSTIDSPTLALITPLLGKSLRGRSSVLRRKAARVIDNMCRLVYEPSNVAPFMPLLLPALSKVIDEVTDPEVCEVASAAKEILLKAIGAKPNQDEKSVVEMALTIANQGVAISCWNGPSSTIAITDVANYLGAALDECCNTAHIFESHNISLIMFNKIRDYVCLIVSHFIGSFYRSMPPQSVAIFNASMDSNGVDLWRHLVAKIPVTTWDECSQSYLVAIARSEVRKKMEDDESNSAPDNSVQLSSLFRKAVLGNIPDACDEDESNEETLCNIEFSLAFGGKTLLHTTNLHLRRGRRYGIMGKNGTGKTTLLTNIASGNIEGLPQELRTVYVLHDDPADDNGVGLLAELLNGSDMIAAQVTEDEAKRMLLGVNFTEEMLSMPRSSLSGGWKMKLLIIRAMLSKPDILLLDEPTNHLDSASVQWLISYLLMQKHLTCMVVSHDTEFLDSIVTDIIHYENRKLVYYHGSLSSFVSTHPEARHYYDLDASQMIFKFPAPGRLDGIASATKTIVKLDNVTFTYPGAVSPAIKNVSVKLCLSSRVAVVGPNGAGKSTLIKLLVQELEPNKDENGVSCGEIWKHPNLRIAYVAQHSFFHVEQHLDISPVDYFKWRFDQGVDKESMSKSNVQMTEEEVEGRKQLRYGDVDKIVGRRKNARTIEYECTFIGQCAKDENKYISLEDMIAKGLEKLVQQADIRIAAIAAGLDLRPLINREIQSHLDDFNLEAEYGTHSNICRLSAGQKVKLVLAAAMWNKPHVIVLDEPTNYLDREALGALTQAIKEFPGAIVIISHHKEFTDSLCSEHWYVNNGVCVVEGEMDDQKPEKTIRSKSSKSSSKVDTGPDDSTSAGNTNSTKVKVEQLLNPKTLEVLTKVEIRKLTRCAAVAGMSLKDYVSRINKNSPEWQWLSNTIK